MILGQQMLMAAMNLQVNPAGVARRPQLYNLDALIARDGSKLVCLLRVSPIGHQLRAWPLADRVARLCDRHARVITGAKWLCLYRNTGRYGPFLVE